MKKKRNFLYFISGDFAGVGFGSYLAVLIEALINKYEETPAWVETAKMTGLIGVILLFISLVVIVFFELKKAKKNESKVSDEELLEKYKSVKKK